MSRFCSFGSERDVQSASPEAKPRCGISDHAVIARRVSAGTRDGGDFHKIGIANRRAPFAVSLARAVTRRLTSCSGTPPSCVLAIAPPRVSTASPRFASAPPAVDLADSRHDGVPEPKAKSRSPARDAGEDAARGRRGYHPHRLTHETPGRGVRQHRIRRSRDQGTSPRPLPSANCARDRKRASFAPHEAYRFETKNKTRFHAAPVKALTKSTPLFLDVTPPERVSIRG